MAKIGMSQKERDSNMKAMAIYLGVVLGLISIYSFCYIFSLQESERVGLFDSFKIFMGSISEGKFGFEINAQAAYGIPSGAFVGLLVFFFIDNDNKYFSEMLGNMTVQQESRQIKTGKQGSGNNIGPTKREVMTADELGRMPSDECIVFTQNRRPVRDKKYKYENHPYYSQTADADNSNGFLYNTMSIYRNNSSTGVEYIMRAYTEANDYKAKQTAKSRMEKSKIDTANDILSGDEKAEENACKVAIQEGVFEVTNNYDNPVAVIRTNPIPTKYLLKIASSVSSITKKYPFIVFCKATLPGKEKYMVGVGVGQDDAEMEYIMKTEYTPEVMHRGRYFLTTIEATDYDGFIAASAEKYEQYHKNQE